jgi:hypothetical protein
VSVGRRRRIAVHINRLGLKPELLRDVVEVSSRASAIREEALGGLEVAATYQKADLVRGCLKILGESQQLRGEIKILFPLDAIEDGGDSNCSCSTAFKIFILDIVVLRIV